MADTDPISSEDEQNIKKMAMIGAIMEEGGESFSEDDMRLLRNAFTATLSADDMMEQFIMKYQGLDEDDEEEEDDDEGEINLNSLDW